MQFDSERLREDGLHLGDVTRLVSLIGTAVSGATITIKETTSERDLLDQLRSLALEARKFDVIVAIGHSNATGIQVASDRFAPWDAFAAFVKPFEPKRLVLVACEGGKWLAATVLFGKLPKLRRIFASPVNASKDLATVMLGMVPYVLEVKAPRDNAVRVGQAVSIAVTGGQIRQWKRNDKDNPNGLVLDGIAQVVDPYLREARKKIVSILR